jgi:DnaK suppressor protein
MNVKAPQFDASFIGKQRHYHSRLRKALLAAVENAEADEVNLQSESDVGPREYEDDAQKLAALERDGNMVVRDIERLDRVDRALRKIGDGTYGLSDVSGQPIPRQKLEAVPEAICTLAEEKVIEQKVQR